MGRTIIVNSAKHLTKGQRSKLEQRIQEKFDINDKVLILEPEYSIQVIPERQNY